MHPLYAKVYPYKSLCTQECLQELFSETLYKNNGLISNYVIMWIIMCYIDSSIQIMWGDIQKALHFKGVVHF